AGVDKLRAQNVPKEIAYYQNSVVSAFAPIVTAHRNSRVVEADPCSCDQAWMHQDKPSIAVLLGRTGLASHIGAHAELCSHRLSCAAVDGITHHVDQISDGFIRQSTPALIFKTLEHLAVFIGNAGDKDRRAIFSARRECAVGRYHFEW